MRHKTYSIGQAFHQRVELLSLLYLAIPIIIFCIGWLKPLYAFLLILVLAGCIYLFVRKRTGTNVKPISFDRRTFFLCVAALAAWVLLSGAGGFAEQVPDYLKHNAVLSDLVQKGWPVTYATSGSEKPLVYYLAYYLPAAALGKVFSSLLIANIGMLLWTFAGALLVFYWFVRLVGKLSLPVLALLIFFSGMDVLGHLLVRTSNETAYLFPSIGYFEWYTYVGNLQMSSNTTSLYWVPQHALAGWLITGMLLYATINKQKKYPIILLCALGLFWSPLVTAGLLPILCVYIWQNRKNWKELLNLINLLPFVLVGVLLLFFAAGNTSQPIGTFLDFKNVDWSSLHKIFALIIFLLVEFGVLCWLLWHHVKTRESKVWYALFLSCIAFMVVISLFRYGLFNDLTMRVSLPALMVVCVLVTRYLFVHSHNVSDSRNNKKYIAVVVCVALGAITPLNELNGHIYGHSQDTHRWQSIGNESLDEADKTYTRQYMGNDQDIFFKYLSQ